MSSSKKLFVTPRSLLALIAAFVFAFGCSSGESVPPPTFGVDDAMDSPLTSLPPIDGTNNRPVAMVEDEDGVRAHFVSDELWVSSSDEDALSRLLERWNAEVLLTIDPATDGFEGSDLAKQHLVRIDTALADTARVGEDMQAVDGNSTGDFFVSGQQAIQLFAASAREAAGGLDVGINWVGEGAGDYRDEQINDAPNGVSLFGTAYSRNAFRWPTHQMGNAQDIGVGEAWRLLAVAGKLDNKVKIAILDMGFSPDDDFADGWSAQSNVPFVDAIGTENLLFCGGGSDCPWHGTNAASAAMAVPDNDYGSAGPAGPIADPHLVFTSYDFFTSIAALGEARLAGSRIANMSYGAPVPTALAWSVKPFDVATMVANRLGMLIFASAGNDGKNVDATKEIGFIRIETTWHTPCENSGVVCVGGLAGDSVTLSSSSNYGDEHVDIYAPFTMYVGPDPESSADSVQRINGTSFSSPFVAGVAALIWAADPSLNVGEVAGILFDNTKKSTDDRVKRIVSAHRAVRAALPPSAPNIRFSFPLQDGYQVQRGQATLLSVLVEDVEDGRPCCDVVWSSSRDGELGRGASIQPVFDSGGQRSLEVTATDSDGQSSTARLRINVVNTAPVVRIIRPVPGETVLRGQPFRLQGEADDPNEPGGKLSCTELTWESSVAGDPFPASGCELEVTFASSGPRTLSLSAEDPQGSSDTKAVELTVVEPPPNLPPVVRVDPPDKVPGQDFYPFSTPIILSGTGTDPEGDTSLTYTWTVTGNTIGAVVIGNTPTIQWTPSDTIPNQCGDGIQATVRLTVEDSDGNGGSDFANLEWFFAC